MAGYKLLILTDHTNHSAENSLYALAKSMRAHPRCAQIDVATRGNKWNDYFFKSHFQKKLFVSEVDAAFAYTPNGTAFEKNVRSVPFSQYDAVWLRLPPPLSESFLTFLSKEFPKVLFINNPKGIFETGSKEFLTKFPELCPPMHVCKSIADIHAFKALFPIVLKPFREYGGRGIVRIDGDQVWLEKKEYSLDAFLEKIATQPIEYLGVQFLKNVNQGDKRIIVVNGKILGASLRLPAKGSWICNVSMGGSSNKTQVTPEEIKIIKQLNPTLSKMGIVMYGVDTLVGNDGKRVLSEINTTSIGGLPQIARMTGKPLVQEAANLIWAYITKNSTTTVLK